MVNLLGITGGIAAGKSRVAAWLREHGSLAGLDVDMISKRLLQPQQPGLVALKKRFGSRFLQADGGLDRPGLRRELFQDPTLRAAIDGLLHPLIREAMHREAAELARAGAEVVLVEVPLLYEAGWENDFVLVIVVTAPEEVCLQRLLQRDGGGREEALSALAARLPQVEKIRRADLVIDNSGDWEQTRRQLEQLLLKLQENYLRAGVSKKRKKTRKNPEKP